MACRAVSVFFMAFLLPGFRTESRDITTREIPFRYSVPFRGPIAHAATQRARRRNEARWGPQELRDAIRGAGSACIKPFPAPRSSLWNPDLLPARKHDLCRWLAFGALIDVGANSSCALGAV